MSFQISSGYTVIFIALLCLYKITNVLTWLNIITLLSIICIICTPSYCVRLIERTSIIGSAITFFLSLALLRKYTKGSSGILATYTISEYTINISYLIDGISIIYIILTTFLTVVIILSSKNMKTNRKQFHLIILITQILLINSFITAEIFFFFFLFEVILMPFFFLISAWGSQKERINAATTLAVYTLLGSFSMLVGILVLFRELGTTNLFFIKNSALEKNIEKILFLFFFLAFAFKIPMMPFHIWLPKAHVEAPTAGSALLAGILLKVGSYGYLRFLLSLFPSAAIYYTPFILCVAIISMILSTFAIVRLIDLKRIVAYSSIAHMNYLIAGLSVQSLCSEIGSLLLQIAHGLASAGLFLCVGALYDRYKTRNIYYYRGLNTVMPWFSFFFFLLCLANIGFPFTLNFIAEVAILCGLFETVPTIALLTLLSAIVMGVYSFVIITKTIYGKITSYIKISYDLTRRETYAMLLCLIPLLMLGLSPTMATIIFCEELR